MKNKPKEQVSKIKEDEEAREQGLDLKKTTGDNKRTSTIIKNEL